uniref:Ig-like domain-containing protein n=1 Tax=Anas platyrhynchos platyrhynchos TaxID=8840 RepID=A0A493TMH5_ANAPP
AAVYSSNVVRARSLLQGLWYSASLVLGGVLVRLWGSGHGLSVQGCWSLGVVKASRLRGPVLLLLSEGCVYGVLPDLHFLSFPSPGSLVQAALTQPASKSVNPGDTVQITCSGGSAASDGKYYYAWYQQKTPGTGPVTVIYSNDKRPSGISSRFSASTSGSTNTLTITGVQAKDEAVYYCGSYDSSSGGVGVSESNEHVLEVPWPCPTVMH